MDTQNSTRQSAQSLWAGRPTRRSLNLETGPTKRRNHTYLLEKKIPCACEKNVEFVTGDLKKFVHQLKESTEQDIWLVGGSQLIKAFLAENLVQDLIIFIVPVILGGGIPLFDRIGKQIKLKTFGIEKYENGIVRVNYEVQRG